MCVCSKGIASLQGQLQIQAPFKKSLRTSGFSCSAEPGLLVQLQNGTVKLMSLVLPGAWCLSLDAALHTMALHGPWIHIAAASSFAVVEPFFASLTLMGSWKISHLYFPLHSMPAFFCYATLSVRDNSARSWNLNKCSMILQETFSSD